MARKMIIDTDTASDDAVALVMALSDPSVEVQAITVVAGNVPLEMGLQNALYVRELLASAVPAYAGSERPLICDLMTAHFAHGTDGMGDVGLPLGGRRPDSGHAVDVIVDLVYRSPGEVTLVAIGPLTNVALALRKDPAIATMLDRLVVMGGSVDGTGNITPTAEFNIFVDPEAADVVFRSGAPIELVGYDVSRRDATMSEEELLELATLGPLGEFCSQIEHKLLVFCRDVTQNSGIDQPDPLTMAIAIDPEVAVEADERYIAVETLGKHTRGMTVVDKRNLTGNPPNAKVVLAANRDRFLQMLRQACTTRATRAT